MEGPYVSAGGFRASSPSALQLAAAWLALRLATRCKRRSPCPHPAPAHDLRHAHRPADARRHRRVRRGSASPKRSARARRSRSWCSTSTASNRSTIRSATKPATSCCASCRSGCARCCAGDVLGRLAGDEFVVLGRVGTGAIPAEVTVETIFAALREPFSIDGHDIDVAVSAGISMFPPHGTTFDLLLRRAETAMRAAKQHRARQFPLLLRGDEQVRGRAPGARGRPAPRDPRRTARAALPAEGGHREQSRAQRRGAAALAASAARPRAAERVHSDRGRDRPDPADRRMGAARGVRADARVARLRNAAAARRR